MLTMSLTLNRDGEPLLTRGPEMIRRTGFRWGVLSDASEPSVDLAITLKDGVMCQAFLGGIAGCDYRNLRVDGTDCAVHCLLKAVRTPNLPRRTPVEVAAIEEANSAVVSAYQGRRFSEQRPERRRRGVSRRCGASACCAWATSSAWPRPASSELGLPIGTVWSVASRPPSTSPRRLSRAVVERRRFGLRCLGRPDRELLGLPLDFACYVEIDNTGGASDLVLQSANASEGSFVVGPPTWIPQGMVARLVLRDPKPSIHGSDGTIRYGYSNADLTMQAVTLHFECPTGILNKATSSQAARVTWAKSTNPKCTWSTRVPSGGHPLFVGHVIGGGQPPRTRALRPGPVRRSSVSRPRVSTSSTSALHAQPAMLSYRRGCSRTPCR